MDKIYIVLSVIAVWAFGVDGKSNSITIRMPGVKPMKRDTYLCTSHKLPPQPTSGKFCNADYDFDSAILFWLLTALWSGTNKNRDVSTGPLARPFAHSLAPLTRGKV